MKKQLLISFFAATVHGLCKKQRHFMSACSKTDALSYGDSVFLCVKMPIYLDLSYLGGKD